MSKELDPRIGWLQAAFQAPCDLSDINPSRDWISSLLRQNPDLTGWPFFVDLWTPRRPEFKPKISNGIWEARMISPDDDSDAMKDIWRIDGKRGLFYAARAFQDDTNPDRVKPGTKFDFVLAILRTAELIIVAERFCGYLCREMRSENAVIPLSLEWSGLSGRVLSSWSTPSRWLSDSNVCESDDVAIDVDIPLGVTNDGVVVLTKKVIDELFLEFDGFSIKQFIIEDLVGKLISRTL